MATSGATSDDEYAVLCGAIFLCLFLCSIFVLAGFISRSAHRDEHAAPLSAERLPAFGANTFRSCTCCPGGISDGLCNARQSVSRVSVDRGTRAPAIGAAAGGALRKARNSVDRGTPDAAAGHTGWPGSQHASHATHHKAPVLAGRKTVDPGDHPASAGPQAAPRDGLSRRFNMARYSSGGGEYPDPSLGRYERADCPSAAALIALRYSCTSSSSTSQAKQPDPATRRQAASNRAVSAPMPLAALAASNIAAAAAALQLQQPRRGVRARFQTRRSVPRPTPARPRPRCCARLAAAASAAPQTPTATARTCAAAAAAPKWTRVSCSGWMRRWPAGRCGRTRPLSCCETWGSTWINSSSTSSRPSEPPAASGTIAMG